MDWREAFIAQAKSDYEVALLLSKSAGVHACHLLHYLQMALEKLSKGFMSPPNSMTKPAKVHSGATKLIQFLKKKHPQTASFHTKLGMNEARRKMYLNDLLPEVQFIEKLNPSLSNDSVNAEYPWLVPAIESNSETVIAPTHYNFDSVFRRVKLPKILQLIRTIIESSFS